MKQAAPYCIQVEPTQGCNLQCSFCGINGIQNKPAESYRFMNVHTAKRIAQEIKRAGWNSRIEFAMHGEPTMNPDLREIISIFRNWLPKNQLMVTSNGGGLLKNTPTRIQELFDAGLNILALDAYENVNIVPKIFDRIKGIERDYSIVQYPNGNATLTPHSRWPRGTRVVMIVQDISSANDGVHATLNNHCGMGASLNNSAQGKKCAKPFREMSIRWDGSISLCCNSFSGRYDCGNINHSPIDEIWNNKAFRIARLHLYHGMRDFTPCQGCDALSYRVGLLPDAKGLKELRKPTRMEKGWARQHGAEKPLTIEVKQPEWKQ